MSTHSNTNKKADVIHLSSLLIKGICGVTKTGKFTGDHKAVTCERCLVKIKNANAVEADLWAMEAAQYTRDHSATRGEHVRALYMLALEKRKAAIERAEERVSYAKGELADTAQRAAEWGGDREH